MKYLIALSSVALLFSSCRTVLPLDPNTAKPSARCLPYTVQKTVYESSK